MRAAPLVVVHGGAGKIPDGSRPAREDGCRRAADAGLAVLSAGGSVLDAVVRAVTVLEDDPLFNAGTGACLTRAGSLELDASVMVGKTLAAGAVAALPPFRNPIQIARAVLEDGKHVMYAAEGACDFARARGFDPASPDSMITDQARERLAEVLAGRAEIGWPGGTVGAVASDGSGSTAAATSTGGTVAKAVGRVGDTPIIGAGTYADDDAGACSATGIGETIIRACLAREAVDLMRQGHAAQQAAVAAIARFGDRVGGSGGIVVVDRRGRAGVAFNTETMSHAIARLGERTLTGS